MSALFISLVVIFIAELGDKSQLMALAFATRYRMMPVLIGITAATAVVHAVSVLIGAALGVALPTRPIAVLAGIAFLIFAVWTYRGDKLTEEERSRVDRSTKRVIMTVATVFFLAELGDKTMLATITLATKEGLWGTWLGSTVGMVVADALAIVVGAHLGRRLPEQAVRYFATASFAIFGCLLIAEGALG